MPGGIMITVSDKAKRDLAAIAPTLSIEAFERAVGAYNIEIRHVESSPADAQKALDVLANQAILLATRMQEVRLDEGPWNYLSDECLAFGDVDLPLRLESDLLRLFGIAENARRVAESQTEKGRDLAHRTRLISRLASAVSEASLPVDAKSNGCLVRIFGVAMKELNIEVADHKGTVRSALKSINGKQ